MEINNNIVERYRGSVGVSGYWLGGLLGIENYKSDLKRGNIRSLRRGGNGRTALIDYESMSSKMKERVKRALGYDPKEVNKQSMLLRIMQERDERMLNGLSYDYFSNVKDVKGHYLPEDKVEMMWNSAKILDAIEVLLQEKRMAGTINKRSINLKKEFNAIAKEIDLSLRDMVKKLPKSGNGLYKKYNEYKAIGYAALVHGAIGKEGNHQKYTKEEKAVITELVASGAKLNDVQVSKMAGMLGIEMDRRRVQEVRKDNEMMIQKDREGKSVYRNNTLMQVDRERPDMPLKMVSLDGWDAELYYKNEKSSYNRLCVVVVIDVMNNYPLGYAIGDHENAELIKSALMSAVHHTREVLGNYYGLWQIQSDNYAKKALMPYYQAICKHYTPAAVGNAKAKPIERYFHYLETEYLWMLSNNSGHNITAKSKTNDEWLSRNKRVFPDRESCIAQIEKIMEIERSRKIGEVRSAWNEGGDEFKLPFDMEKYLLTFGEVGRGNMLTANGMKVIREGKEYKFDCFDGEMRKYSGERWYLHYDMADMNRALAVNEDRTLRFMMEAKVKVPMAMVDYKEEDWKALSRYREFNINFDTKVNDERKEVRALAEGYITRAQLEGDLSGRLLVDNKGQHKNRKYEEREQKLIERAVVVEAEEIESAEERRARIVKEAFSAI